MYSGHKEANLADSQSVVQALSPFTSSIDGNDPPAAFNAQYIKLLIQSPMVVYLSILSAAYFQATLQGVDVEKSVDSVKARVKLVSLLNAHISEKADKGQGVSDDAIAAVMSLSYNEVSNTPDRPSL